MIATSLRKVTTQPFDFTCNSSPSILGNSISILVAVLHYKVSFVFLFSPTWIYFLSTSKCRDCSIYQVHDMQRSCYQKCVLQPHKENSVSAEAFSKWTETDVWNKFLILADTVSNKSINQNTIMNYSSDIIAIHWNTTAASPAYNATWLSITLERL